MWKPISQPAPGFLSLLGLKNTGRNPGVLLDDVRGTIDLTQFWLEGTAIERVSAVSTNNPRIGTSIVHFIVPVDELWFVHQYSARFEVNFGPAVLVDIRQPVLQAVSANLTVVRNGVVGPDLVENPVVKLTTPVCQLQAMTNFWAPGGTRLRIAAAYADIQNAGGTELLAAGGVKYTPLRA